MVVWSGHSCPLVCSIDKASGKSARSTFAQPQAPKVHAQKVMPGNCNWAKRPITYIVNCL